ncbi:unnamed protein product [Rotaria socialis]|uniref:HMG box domain-containing protein n=1 Tax=Rotaria socialis TaxID=392032 RepID=A0A818KF00_9BILA|nr:unnamed protein product [Rotaria socialis]CAF3584656.1 unnamed protein product [Rotaria socialis]CAF3708962.1 unnamed protein product [Rotaria socialis]CAF4446292.1 unnamed protein product [Rotaria socialis]CAF4603649.1 unnamed protein product [Rotaria socialis]
MPSKLTKDANAPKKPLSAYILFSVDERPKLKATGLDNFAEMSKTLAAAGKQAHYEKEHEQEKIRFENELKEYQKSDQPAPPSKVGQKLQLVSKSETTKSTTTTTAATKSKKSATAVKNESEDDEESEVQSEKEEEEKLASPVNSSRKKI